MMPAAIRDRLTMIARGYISDVHGRDWLIHNVNEEGVAFQMPGGIKGSSSQVYWWEILAWQSKKVDELSAGHD